MQHIGLSIFELRIFILESMFLEWFSLFFFLVRYSTKKKPITAFTFLVVSVSGGAGDDGGCHGNDGTITGKKCPKGLYGTFCKVKFI